MSFDCPLLLTTLTALGEIALLAPTLFETQRPAIVRDFVVKELLMKDRVSKTIIITLIFSCCSEEQNCHRSRNGRGKVKEFYINSGQIEEKMKKNYSIADNFDIHHQIILKSF